MNEAIFSGIGLGLVFVIIFALNKVIQTQMESLEKRICDVAKQGYDEVSNVEKRVLLKIESSVNKIESELALRKESFGVEFLGHQKRIMATEKEVKDAAVVIARLEERLSRSK